MIHYKTDSEVELIRQSSLMVSKTLALVAKHIKPGISGLELDKMAEEFIRDNGGKPAFKGYNGFPGTLCVSPNEAVVHGIPNDKPFEDGDIVSVDCGVEMNGFFGDSAYTFPVGNVADEILRLMRVTQESLELAIAQARSGNRMGDIGFAVQNHCEKENNYGVVRELVGHGLGASLHEDPEVPNTGRRGNGLKLQENLVLAIEPMVNLGKRAVITAEDNWTVVSKDGSPSAHYEHTLVVKKGEAEVLTTFSWIEEEIKKNTEIPNFA